MSIGNAGALRPGTVVLLLGITQASWGQNVLDEVVVTAQKREQDRKSVV